VVAGGFLLVAAGASSAWADPGNGNGAANGAANSNAGGNAAVASAGSNAGGNGNGAAASAGSNAGGGGGGAANAGGANAGGNSAANAAPSSNAGGGGGGSANAGGSNAGGNSGSNPDGGGLDKPGCESSPLGCQGDKHDMNNGCGNDPDRADDNKGNCGHKKDKDKPVTPPACPPGNGNANGLGNGHGKGNAKGFKQVCGGGGDDTPPTVVTPPPAAPPVTPPPVTPPANDTTPPVAPAQGTVAGVFVPAVQHVEVPAPLAFNPPVVAAAASQSVFVPALAFPAPAPPEFVRGPRFVAGAAFSTPVLVQRNAVFAPTVLGTTATRPAPAVRVANTVLASVASPAPARTRVLPAAPKAFAFTGSDAVDPTTTGLVLMLAGTLMVMVSRRRPASSRAARRGVAAIG
jgi:hypothetical protein